MFNLRGDDGADTGGLAVDTNLGWKGASKYVATVPQVFDLLADPQERYDIFMTTSPRAPGRWSRPTSSVAKLMKTYVKYPPRKLQSETYTGPITISKYQLFKSVQEQLAKEGSTSDCRRATSLERLDQDGRLRDGPPIFFEPVFFEIVFFEICRARTVGIDLV